MKRLLDDATPAAPPRDVMVTLPAGGEWVDYQRELAAAAQGGVLAYRVPTLPTQPVVGGRCYLVHRGLVRGWMPLVAAQEISRNFTCDVTGTVWEAGKYLLRSGEFHLLNPVAQRGFQGWKYVTVVERVELERHMN